MSLLCYGLGQFDKYNIGTSVKFKKVLLSQGITAKRVSLKLTVKKIKVKVGVCEDG